MRWSMGLVRHIERRWRAGCVVSCSELRWSKGSGVLEKGVVGTGLVTLLAARDERMF
jgi:hypothetical protein